MEKDYCDLPTITDNKSLSVPQTLVTSAAGPPSGGAFGRAPLGNVKSMGTQNERTPGAADRTAVRP